MARPIEMITKDVESDTCGCVGLGHAIHFCPTHAAAPALLAAAEKALDWMEGRRGGTTEKMTADEVLTALREAISAAGGGKVNAGRSS